MYSLMICNAEAKVYSGGGGPLAFAQIPVSPREVAMGGMGVAFSTGPFSMFWNPAGIAKEDDIKETEIGMIQRWSHPGDTDDYFNLNSSTDDGWDFMYFGLLHKLWDVDCGLNLYSRGINNIQQTQIIPNTNEIETIGVFDSRENMISIALAKRIAGDYSLGIDYKNGWMDIGRLRSPKHQHGIDLGFRGSLDSLQIGIALQTTFESLRSEDDIYQYGIRTGACYQFSKQHLMIGFEGNASNYSPLKCTIGGEIYFWELLISRIGFSGGVGSNGDSFSWDSTSLGFGFNKLISKFLHFSKAEVDISYTIYMNYDKLNKYNYDSESLSLVDSPLKTSISIKF